MPVRFFLNGSLETVDDADPTGSVLNWLRYDRRLTGTKEGCNEGDCGACTIVVGEVRGGKLRRRAVNACTMFLPMLDGKEVFTVEHLENGQSLHPVQSAVADLHGSQCGFCTPGFVMTLFAEHEGMDDAPRGSVDDVLAGNLCRCTGYGPLREAGNLAAAAGAEAASSLAPPEALTALGRDEMLTIDHDDPIAGEQRRFRAPRTIDELMAVLAEDPDAVPVAGGTDVGLWVTKGGRRLRSIVSLNEIEELRRVEETPEGLTIGAGVRYSDAWGPIGALYPDFGELIRRIGALQVRNAGTIGGNVANGSPIGDTMPAMIALGATLVLVGPSGERRLPLEDFFLDYGKQDRQPGEIVARLMIPRPAPDQKVGIYKISKRFDQDISAVCGAFSATLQEERCVDPRISFGGMAAIPKRAAACEAVLRDAAFTAETVERAAEALAKDFAPISDMRASSAYRLTVAQNLLRKFFLETTEPSVPTRLAGGIHV